MLRDNILRVFVLFVLMGAALAQKTKPTNKPLSFTYYDIVVPGATITEPRGINDQGEIVGACSTGGFIMQNGIITIYDPYYDTGVEGVNAAGELVASYEDYGSPPESFVVSTTGVISPLNYPEATGTVARSINDSGEVAGLYYNNSEADSSYQGFLYRGGQFITIDFPTAQITEAEGVNDSGEIAGIWVDADNNAHGFTYQNGTFTQLNAPGCLQSGALGINNLGDVVGFCQTARFGYGFLYKNGAYTFLSDPKGIGSTLAYGVNDSDDIVGYYAPAGTFDMYNGFVAIAAEAR
jgi:probable HAF family extracellular repeat protein